MPSQADWVAVGPKARGGAGITALAAAHRGQGGGAGHVALLAAPRAQALHYPAEHWIRLRTTNPIELVVLVRAGTTFTNGKLVERSDEPGGDQLGKR